MKVHADWVKARVQLVSNIATKTYMAFAPRVAGALPAAPYVVIHSSDGIDSQDRYTGPRVTQHPRFTLHIVGTSYDSVAAVTRNIKAQFIVNGFGVIPVIEGERCWGLWWDAPVPTEVDNDVSPPIVYNIIELGFTTEPASA